MTQYAWEQLAKQVSRQLLDITEEPKAVVDSPKTEHGTLATPIAFSLARKERKPPAAIAQEIAKKIKPTSLIASAEALNGYINFHATDAYYALAATQALDEKFGDNDSGKNKKFIIDYSDPNIGKPFHVGHIRSTILGAAILALKKHSGYKTTGYTFLGDSGTQVAKLIVALDEFKDLPKATDERGLLEYYKKIHAAIEAQPELAEKARKTHELLEKGDASTVKKAEKIRAISLAGFEKNWLSLGVSFDKVTGESAFIAPAQKIVDELVKKKIAFIDEKEKSTILGLEKHGLPNTVIARSDGTTLYLTRDIAREDWAYKTWAYDESLVITASEQNNHFRQLHKTAELLKRAYAGKLAHVGFGLVFLESGKISSREGRVVFLDDVINAAVKGALDEIKSRELPYTEKEAERISRAVGVGALKFSFLRVSAEKNITFDPAKAVSFEGDTSAHVQYTIVRCNNIMEKSGEKLKMPKDARFDDAEKRLAGTIAQYPLVIEKAQSSLQVHVLCDYAIKLSSAYSSFYESNPVLKAPTPAERSKRLCLVAATANTLTHCLTLLGIEVPEKM